MDAVVAEIVAPRNFQSAIGFTFAMEGIGTLIAGPISGNENTGPNERSFNSSCV